MERTAMYIPISSSEAQVEQTEPQAGRANATANPFIESDQNFNDSQNSK